MMNGDPRANLTAIRQKMEHLTAVKADLPALREKLGEDLFQFERLEARVNELDAQVRSLGSFSLAGIASALTGTKRRKLDALTEELAPLTQKYSADVAALQQLSEQVQVLESELEGLHQIEKQYEGAIEAVARSLRTGGGETADRLAGIEDHLRQIGEQLRTLGKAIEAAEQAENHLDSMTRSLGNVNTKIATYRSPFGAVGQAVHTAYTQSQAKGPVRLVRQALERLTRHINELPLDEDIEVNRELRQLSVSLEEVAVKLSEESSGGFFGDMSATLPIKQDVRAALNLCTRLRKELTPQLEALQQQRRTIIEEAL